MRDKVANSERLPNGGFLRSFKTSHRCVTTTTSFFQYAVVSLVICLAKTPTPVISVALWRALHVAEAVPRLLAAPRRHLVDAVSDEGVVCCAVVISAYCDGLVPPPQRY